MHLHSLKSARARRGYHQPAPRTAPVRIVLDPDDRPVAKPGHHVPARAMPVLPRPIVGIAAMW
jgi:hypothetical protein